MARALGLTEQEMIDYFGALEKRLFLKMDEIVITVKHAHFKDVGHVGDWRYYIDQDEWAKASVGKRVDAFLAAYAKAEAEEWD